MPNMIKLMFLKYKKFEMIKSINTHDEFIDAMNIIDEYVNKATDLGGFKALSPLEITEYGRLALLIEAYEDSIPVIPENFNLDMPFEKLVLICMMAKRWKVAETADKLGISEADLSEILAGKRIIDNTLRKKIELTLDMIPDKRLQAA